MPLLPREPCIYPNDLLAEDRSALATPVAWWVLHVRPRMEKVLARRFHGCQTPFFLPLYERQWVQRGRRQCSHLPLFPGYVFMLGDDEARLSAITTNLVAQAIPVSDQKRLWNDLQRVAQVMNSDRPLEPADLLQPGNPVVVSHGPLAGLSGHVLQRTRPWKLIVEVRFLQRGVAVELEDWMLDPADLQAERQLAEACS